jgi:hypothetical protein
MIITAVGGKSYYRTDTSGNACRRLPLRDRQAGTHPAKSKTGGISKQREELFDRFHRK